jgi:hypothetical protein
MIPKRTGLWLSNRLLAPGCLLRLRCRTSWRASGNRCLATARPAGATSSRGGARGLIGFAPGEALLPARLADILAASQPGHLSPAAVGTSPAEVGGALDRPWPSRPSQFAKALLSLRDKVPRLDSVVLFHRHYEVPCDEVAKQSVERLDSDLLIWHRPPSTKRAIRPEPDRHRSLP